MLALTLTDTKDFMNKLLRTEMMDHFLLQEGKVTMASSYVIDGKINRDFFSEGELDELGISGCDFLPFSMLRGNFFDMMKGKKTPTSFQFVFMLSPENLARTVESIGGSYTPLDVTGMFLNIRFTGGTLTLTTGISYKIFSPDKTLDHGWDRMVTQFLKKNGVEFEEG